MDQKHCTTREKLRTTPNITELQDMRGNGGNAFKTIQVGSTPLPNKHLLLTTAAATPFLQKITSTSTLCFPD